MLLQVPNHALKDIYILNYGTFQKIVFIVVPPGAIDFINSVIAMQYTFFYKPLHFFTLVSNIYDRMTVLSENCLASAYSTTFSLSLIISVTWLTNFRMAFLFYMSLSSVYLFSIQPLRALIAEM